MKTFILFLFFHLTLYSQNKYQADILGENYEQTTLKLENDYDGEIFCTLVRAKQNKKTKKAILYIHGFNDYFFQTEMAENFIAKGYDFYAVDLRRYGRSWRSNQKMCDIRNIKDYFKDIDTCLKIIKAEGAINTVILGHSTGGLTASLYAHHHPNSDLFQALILNSPFFDFNTSNFTKRTLLPFVFQKGKKHPDKLLKKDGLSVYGESISIKYHGEWTFNENWKPIETGPISYGWFNAIHQGHVEVSNGLKINQPTLILHSDHSVYGKVWNLNFQSGDAVLNVQDIQKESKKIMGSINIVQIKDGMHDLILSKIEVRTVVYEQIFNWCETLK